VARWVTERLVARRVAAVTNRTAPAIPVARPKAPLAPSRVSGVLSAQAPVLGLDAVWAPRVEVQQTAVLQSLGLLKTAMLPRASPSKARCEAVVFVTRLPARICVAQHLAQKSTLLAFLDPGALGTGARAWILLAQIWAQ